MWNHLEKKIAWLLLRFKKAKKPYHPALIDISRGSVKRRKLGQEWGFLFFLFFLRKNC